ncbi:MAG: glycerophosphodiester phosphodiesterase family protein [Lachnospiraceae bacterium]|nr:glycerophosphodiester phosphodiesterase family protein [Lachnospiraceae bacterium]
MKFDLQNIAKEHRIIVAHRGVSGGNIPCNTVPAYETALRQGADMIETDVDITADGVLVIFHPGMEKRYLGIDQHIGELSHAEVKKLRYLNPDGTPTQFGLPSFDELLEQFKGKCLINVDKYWGCPKEIYHAIKRHDMIDQILVKSSLSEQVLQVLEELSPDLPFMPIVKEEHPLHEALMRRKIRYVGAEVLFTREESAVAAPAFIDRMHQDGKLVWANAIIYNYRDQLAAGHSDDTALTASLQEGWGWLADRGFDLIQTDWPLMLIEYLKQTERYQRKTDLRVK